MTIDWTEQMPSGGFGDPGFDLFSTFTQMEALSALGLEPGNLERTRHQLHRLVGRRGVGVARGAEPDVWSTAMAAQLYALSGEEAPPALAQFLLDAEEDGAFNMSSKEGPSVWSVFSAGFTLNRTFDLPLPTPESTLTWLASCQAPSGGICWRPRATAAETGEARAAEFSLLTAKAHGLLGELLDRLDVPGLLRWIDSLRVSGSGYRLSLEIDQPCLWATASTTSMLDMVLGPDMAISREVVTFVESMAMIDGSFRRGARHTCGDAFATRHGLRALRHLGQLNPAVAQSAAGYLTDCELPAGGATFRPPEDAPDAHATAGMLLANRAPHPTRALEVLLGNEMHEEGGFAYNQARGAEASTGSLVVAAAGHLDSSDGRLQMRSWAQSSRDVDGGWSVFVGRFPTSAATCAVLGALDPIDRLAIAGPATRLFVFDRWMSIGGVDALELVEAWQLFRLATWLDVDLGEPEIRDLLAAGRVRGAWRGRRRGFADLLSTYQALLTHQVLGDLADVLPAAQEWVRSLDREHGAAWTARASASGGPLASGLAACVLRADPLASVPLPEVSL